MTTVVLETQLLPTHRQLLATLDKLVTQRFSKRAQDYDDRGVFPEQDFQDLHEEGYLATGIGVDHGGQGVGPSHGSTLTLWLMTRSLARANLSLARCWEGHQNSVVLLNGIASQEQRERWFDGIVSKGERWVAWSGEPQAPKPGQSIPVGTRITRVDGGYRVDGTKVFASSAGSADWAILLCSMAGAGGARHSQADHGKELLMLACHLRDGTVTLDDSFWRPLGMRSTVSHMVQFDGTFVPDANVIGRPGQYLEERWQALFAPHYAASFLGAAESVYGYALEYARARNHGEDPYMLHHLAQMTVSIDSSRLWLAHVAELWNTEQVERARYAGAQARHVVEHRAKDVVEHATRICGARGLLAPSVLERVLRDLSMYVRHDNDDQIQATLGRAALGLRHDVGFYKP